jgi:hypothetical protein
MRKFDGLNEVSSFVNEFELQIPKQTRLLALDVALISTPIRWWATHKEGIKDLQHCKRIMHIRFGIEKLMHKYTRMSDLKDHIA